MHCILEIPTFQNIPFLYQGVVLGMNFSFGYIEYSKDPKLVFDLSEVMEENKLSISEKVEFTLVPVS